jgi:3-hydroxymyristoyl/3-hydroxydecanoyl-(acyl carrier protein) dehydratase
VEVRVPVHSSHPAFSGHFPGEPIFPGVALLGLVVSALQEGLGDDLWVTAIPSVRWRAVVRPDAVLDVRLSRLDNDDHVGFEVWSDKALVSHGTLVVARAER